MEGANRKPVEADPQGLQAGLHMVRCGISAIPSLPRRLGQANSGTKNYPEKRSQGPIFAALGPKMRSKKGSFLRSQNATAISLPLRIPSINHFFGLVLRPRFRIKIRPKKRRLERNFGCNLKPISGLGGPARPSRGHRNHARNTSEGAQRLDSKEAGANALISASST